VRGLFANYSGLLTPETIFDFKLMKTLRTPIVRLCLHGFLVATLMMTVSGCGTSAEVLDAQEKQIEEDYKHATTHPPNMTPKMLERRQRRVEMDFGIRTEQDEANSETKGTP
jgi:hypothetical protein